MRALRWLWEWRPFWQVVACLSFAHLGYRCGLRRGQEMERKVAMKVIDELLAGFKSILDGSAFTRAVRETAEALKKKDN